MSSESSASPLTVTPRDIADCRLVSVAGKVDHTNSDDFLDELTRVSEMVPAGGGMVIDLGGLEFITSAGLRALLLAQRTVKNAGGTMVVSGISGVVKEVFRISKFDALLNVADTTQDAVGQISPAAAEAFSA